jgi:hypothetical protein
MLAQKSAARRAVGVAAAGLAIAAVIAIAVWPASSQAPTIAKLTFAIAPGATSPTAEGLARTIGPLRQLKASGRPLVVHLYSVFPGDTTAAPSWGAYRIFRPRSVRASWF